MATYPSLAQLNPRGPRNAGKGRGPSMRLGPQRGRAANPQASALLSRVGLGNVGPGMRQVLGRRLAGGMTSAPPFMARPAGPALAGGVGGFLGGIRPRPGFSASGPIGFGTLTGGPTDAFGMAHRGNPAFGGTFGAAAPMASRGVSAPLPFGTGAGPMTAGAPPFSLRIPSPSDLGIGTGGNIDLGPWNGGGFGGASPGTAGPQIADAGGTYGPPPGMVF